MDKVDRLPIPARTGQNVLSRLMILWLILGVVTACAPWTRPDNEQIQAAIQRYHETAASTLILDFDSMKVPQRSLGKAAAVIWTADHAVQRNYRVEWDTAAKEYSVSSYLTLERGEDGVYRRIEEIILH